MKKSTMVKLAACFVLGGAFAATVPAMAENSAPAQSQIVTTIPTLKTTTAVSTQVGFQP